MAHITGGGLEANTNRVIPDGLCAYIDWDAWVFPTIFSHIQSRGNITNEEMRRVFNCGVGYTAIVDPTLTARIIARFHGIGIKCIKIGKVVSQ